MEEIYKNLNLCNLPNEEWRDIEGYNGKYQVSNYGRVKSLRDKYGNYREKILSQSKNNKGYLKVTLCKDGKIRNFTVHNLVGVAFVPNIDGLQCIKHKNNLRCDNNANNLEWCTKEDILQINSRNIDYREIAKKLSKKVYQYDLNKNLIAIWSSTKECSLNGYNQGNVASCCSNFFNRKGNNIYKNYIWSYTEL